MAGTSLFALLDDIATLLDDISVMTKVAAKKTAGVLGDDLALNADQVTGMASDRELPVIWAVAKGAALNKAILVPAALLISAFIPWAIMPLLMLGGAYLCYEGFHKVFHHFFGHGHGEEKEVLEEVAHRPEIDLVEFEKEKIKGAVRTDFILSAEIVVLALGAVAEKPLTVQIGVLVAIALLMNVGVYGLVACIVKLDDLGFYLAKRKGDGAMTRGLRALGQGVLTAAPWLMKGLSLVGTVAMFLVGGGIFAHAIHAIEAFFHTIAAGAGLLEPVVSILLSGILGIVVGGIVAAGVGVVQKVLPERDHAA
jgi:predicted DNA repair protein MutK